MRAISYFLIAALTTLLPELSELEEMGDVSGLAWAKAGIAAVLAGLVAVRALMDRKLTDKRDGF